MYDLIADNYGSIFPVDVETVDFIDAYLKSNNAKKIFDIGCATGDLAIALSQRGYSVSGIDLNARMIDIATTKVDNPLVSFRVANMLELDTGGKYDSVLCLGNTLPHVPSWQELRRFVKLLHSIVNDGGFAIVQILNYDKILRDKKITFQTKESGGFAFYRKYTDITASSITFEIEFLDKASSRKHTDSTKLLPIERNKLIELFSENGFADVAVFSDYDSNAATDDDYFNVFVAQQKRRQ
jgi:glycine/sarcosine N-methyltransferase